MSEHQLPALVPAASPPGLPIEDCPVNDRWFLVYDPDLAPGHLTRPWVIATRCDGGWETEGYLVNPTRYIPLPDPQPEGSGWKPAEGTVHIARALAVTDGQGRPLKMLGKPINWLVFILKPDGSDDTEREPDLASTYEEACGKARALGAQLGLPVIEKPLTEEAANDAE